MLTFKVLIFMLFIINYLNHINGASPPSFVITAPKIVKRWADYNVMVSLYDVPKDTNITLTIDGNGLSTSQTRLLKPVSGIITQLFKMGFDSKWKNGNYDLHAVGTGGIAFTSNFKVNFVDKHYVVLIQSDSPIYRPGDTVIFRVIILDDLMRPVRNKYIEDMKIYIKKAGEISSSEIFGTNSFNISNGVTNDISFSLGDDESIGRWVIEVELSGQKHSQLIFVHRYQTPFATVDIKVPEFKTYTEPFVSIKINCFYTFGKPVIGLATILISKHKECGNKVQSLTLWSDKYNIHGQLDVEIDFRDTKLLNGKCESVLNLTVIVYDNITRQEYANYKMIEFHQQSIVAKNLNPLQKIKPGLGFRVFIEFLNIEGNEVDLNNLNKLQFEAQILLNNNVTKNAIPMAIVKKYNKMVLDFQTDSLTKKLNLNLKLDDKVIANYSYDSYVSCQKTLIQIKLQEPLRRLIVDDLINLIVTGTEAIDYLSYYFLVKGDIVNASSISFGTPDTAVLVPLLLKKEMAPDMTVVVYYHSKTSGIIAFDSLNLQIDGLFQNGVKVKVENSSLDVSQKVRFSIQTEPDSQLLLLGVDKVVMRENINGFITESYVLNQLHNVQETKIIADGDIKSSINFESNAKPQCSNYYEVNFVETEVSPIDFEEVGKLRKDYRKTWIWDRMFVSGKGVANLSTVIPDSITSWQLSVVSLHNVKGLGIASVPIQITAFRPFFIELKLPYSIVRYEKTEIQVMVFNYLTETAQIEIRVEQNLNDSIYLRLESCERNITAEPNQIQVFVCYVTALEVGTTELKARAEVRSKGNTLVTDGEVQTLIVKYEGVVINKVREVYLDFDNEEINNNTIRELLKIEMPSNVIDGSQKIYAVAKSERIDSNWHQSLEHILNTPINFVFPALTTNCYQKMTSFIQQIYQLNYLKIVNKSNKPVIDGMTNDLKTKLATKCSQYPDDGSIVSLSYTGNNPTAANQAKSSTWMTALYLKSLQNLRNHVDVNNNLVYNTIAWLERQQISNGEFLETDPNFNIRPNVGHYGLYLTSFVYIALESDVNYYEPNLKGISYISQLYQTLNNNYDLVIACYVFHISKHENRDQCFSDIMKRSVFKNGFRYWLGVDGKPDIEATSYGLLILVKRKVYSIAFDTFKYLKSVQAANGMIGDSIQTSIALESMSALIKILNNYRNKIRIIGIGINDGENEHRMVLEPENEITQIRQLSSQSKQIDLSAAGYGSAVIEVISQYNILAHLDDAFNTTITNTSPSDSYVNLTVCTRYNLQGSTNNVVIEIDLPTGYKYDANGVYNIDLLDHIESINDSTHVNIFLKKVNSEDICINVPAVQSFKTMSPLPAPIKVYPKNDLSKLTVHELIF